MKKISNIFLNKIICLVIYDVNNLNIYVRYTKKKNFEKMYDILVILVDFCGNFPWFWLIFCYMDPKHWLLTSNYRSLQKNEPLKTDRLTLRHTNSLKCFKQQSDWYIWFQLWQTDQNRSLDMRKTQQIHRTINHQTLD